jgi:hypothetical protein
MRFILKQCFLFFPHYTHPLLALALKLNGKITKCKKKSR